MSAALPPLWLPTPTKSLRFSRRFGSAKQSARRLFSPFRFLFIACLLAVVTLAAAAPAQAGLTGVPQEVAPGVFLLFSEFGVWKDSDDETTFTPTTIVEMKDNVSFGWRFRVETDKDQVKMRVAITLPVPPKIWGHLGEVVEKDVSSDGAMKISADRRTATEEGDYPVVDGWITNTWSFAEGDPVGDHLVRIYINEKLVRVFRFKVIPAKK